MSDRTYEQLIESTERYLRQQQEIFGNEWYLNPPIVSENVSDLDGYHRSIGHCQKCALSQSRIHFVFGTGSPKARLMLIGEAPGEDEDLKGEPFVGKAGQLLDKILAAIEFNRNEVYIANILKCRPPKNRDPLPEEIALCMTYLHHQITLVRPRLILLLGRIAAHALLKSASSLGQMRGKVHRFNGIPVLVTFHPAALLRNPQWKPQAWEDVQTLRKMYDEIVGDKPAWIPKKRN